MQAKVLLQLISTVFVIIMAGAGYNGPVFTDYTPEAPLVSEPSELEKFMYAVGWRESKLNHKVVNSQGMMGKYQFSRTTLRGLRRDITPKQFLSNPHVQDTVMHLYLIENNKLLNNVIKKYDGKVFKGVKVTQSGILAAAHLGGAGSVMNWFKNDSHTGLVDANGTSIREYMIKFGNYSISKYL